MYTYVSMHGVIANYLFVQLMCKRVTNRVAFGKPLAEQGTIQADIGNSRVEIDQARLLCLNAAHRMDLYGNKVAKNDIAAIKVAAPRMAKTVVDRAMQVSDDNREIKCTYLIGIVLIVMLFMTMWSRIQCSKP